MLSAAVTESAYLDFKEFPEHRRNTREGFAKDIAAFSIDGGVLILGVGEPERGGAR